MAETKQETKLKVVQPDVPVQAEILADAIVRLDETANKLLKSGLREDTIVILLHDQTKISKSNIRQILKGLTNLRLEYTTR